MGELTKLSNSELRKIARELNKTVIEYKKTGDSSLKEKIEALSYAYIQSVTKSILLRNSPTHQIKEELAEDVASELYVNRIANPKLKVLDKFDVEAGCSYTTYISRKITPNIYSELNKLAPIKISDEQNRQMMQLRKFFKEEGIDTTDKAACDERINEAKAFVESKTKKGNIDDISFNILWQYFFNKDSNIPISSGEVEKDETAVMLEDSESTKDYENIDILNSVEAMLEKAEEDKVLTKLESEAFKLEICDIYNIDVEDKYNIRGKFNTEISLEETGYKLLVTGLLYDYFPNLAKLLVKKHPNKLKKYEKRFAYLLEEQNA